MGTKNSPADPTHVIHLDDLDLTKKLKRNEYGDKLDKLQKQLVQLQRKVVDNKMRVIMVFEGMDAAGKGGVIKRLVQYLDPRGLDVHAIGAPDSMELSHHYLRRFWLRLPPKKRMAIFDRSWYGRMLVEPIEGFCTAEEYQRAPKEIREFERKLAADGYCIMKFWLHIDKDTQLKRFKSREADPLRQWKLTEEDWRNREKFDLYFKYANALFAATHTPHAPWHLVSANNKPHARVKVLKIVATTLEDW